MHFMCPKQTSYVLFPSRTYWGKKLHRVPLNLKPKIEKHIHLFLFGFFRTSSLIIMFCLSGIKAFRAKCEHPIHAA